MEREHRGPDTGKIELERILDCLRENHYEFEDVEESSTYGFMVANFEKDIEFSDRIGNYINDRHIKIKIEFDSDFDYNNTYQDEEGDFVFDSEKGEQFIQQLLDNDYAPYNDEGGYETDGTENLYDGGKKKRKYGRTKKRRANRKKATRRFRKK
jgi:hypothetical protein